jgi:hypothetical protein
MGLRLRVPIPLVNQGIPGMGGITPSNLAYLDSISVVKPQRTLGAVWTSEKVAQRKPVGMCESCWRKYKGWWKSEHYHPDWGWRYIGDCDGCSIRNLHVTLFHAEEMFYTVLGPNHGLNSSP